MSLYLRHYRSQIRHTESESKYDSRKQLAKGPKLFIRSFMSYFVLLRIPTSVQTYPWHHYICNIFVSQFSARFFFSESSSTQCGAYYSLQCVTCWFFICLNMLDRALCSYDSKNDIFRWSVCVIVPRSLFMVVLAVYLAPSIRESFHGTLFDLWALPFGGFNWVLFPGAHMSTYVILVFLPYC